LAREQEIDLLPEDLISEEATKYSNDNKKLVVKMPSKQANDKQMPLNLGIHTQKEIDGIVMGVLSDGTAFLTGRGLARLCGIGHNRIQNITSDWLNDAATPRIDKIKEILKSHNLEDENSWRHQKHQIAERE
jgi:hypothetical protein